MIRPYDFSSLRLNECNTFGIRIVEQVKKNNVMEMGLKPLVDPLEDTLDKLGKGLNKTSTKLNTLTVKEADSGRDSSVIGLIMYCKAFLYSADEAKKEAAMLLANHYKSFGQISRANYEEASSKVKDLLDGLDSDAKLTDAVNKIQAVEFVEQVRQAQNRFDLVVEERLDVKSAQPDINNRETAKELKEHLETLFQFLEVMQKISPNPAFEVLVDRINGIIDETMHKVKIREGRRAAQKEE